MSYLQALVLCFSLFAAAVVDEVKLGRRERAVADLWRRAP